MWTSICREKAGHLELGGYFIWFQTFVESSYTVHWRHKDGQNVVPDVRELNLSPSRCAPAASLVVINAESQPAPDLLNQSLHLTQAVTAHSKTGDLSLQIGASQP